MIDKIYVGRDQKICVGGKEDKPTCEYAKYSQIAKKVVCLDVNNEKKCENRVLFEGNLVSEVEEGYSNGAHCANRVPPRE